jgi:hypothetical protein
MNDGQLEDIILRMTAERGTGKSICPSEAARAAGAANDTDWHPLMQPVRRAAVRLAKAGRIKILRKASPSIPMLSKASTG